MEEKSFFMTNAGHLTLAFIAIVIAFVVLLIGLNAASDGLCLLGFVLVMLAMLFSPFKKFILKK
ncbi:MAG: hypothetical protein PHN80_09895 [Hespellia sp.]|nr:hypothetical protein [Hespellia sp.]